MYFDDLKITHHHSPIVQAADYYPFGMTFNSYQRTNSAEQRYLYNQGAGEKKFNTERVSDIGLNLDFTKFRLYDYQTGRFLSVDPKADSLLNFSIYIYSINNPISFNDPKGDCPPEIPDCQGRAGMNALQAAFQPNVVNNIKAANNSSSNIFSFNAGAQVAGLGAKLKISGILHLEASGKVGIGEVGYSNKEGIDPSISAASSSFGLKLGKFGVDLKSTNMKYNAEGFNIIDQPYGASFGKIQLGESANEISVGGVWTHFSVEISANISAIEETIENSIDAVKSYFRNILPLNVFGN